MSLEQEILDRLETRNAQIAQLQSTIQALERAADAERERTRQQLEPLIEENKRLAARVESGSQIVTDLHDLYNQRISARDDSLTAADRIQKSLNDEITKRDHDLRAHEKELAESREEIRKLRAEVSLESTREALKNAVAKLQEVTTDRDRVLNELAAILAEANKSGRCNGDPVALIRQGQVDSDAVAFFWSDNERRDALISKLQADLGKETEARNQAEADGKTAQADAQRLGDECARLAGKVLAEVKAEEQRLRVALDESCRARIGLELERDKLKAKLEPLEKMYVKINSISRENGFVASRFKEVLTAVDETTEALSQLTA